MRSTRSSGQPLYAPIKDVRRNLKRSNTGNEKGQKKTKVAGTSIVQGSCKGKEKEVYADAPGHIDNRFTPANLSPLREEDEHHLEDQDIGPESTETQHLISDNNATNNSNEIISFGREEVIRMVNDVAAMSARKKPIDPNEWAELECAGAMISQLPEELSRSVEEKVDDLFRFFCEMAKQYNVKPSAIKRRLWSYPHVGRGTNDFNNFLRYSSVMSSTQEARSTSPDIVQEQVRKRAKDYHRMKSEGEDSLEWRQFQAWQKDHEQLFSRSRSVQHRPGRVKLYSKKVENIVST